MCNNVTKLKKLAVKLGCAANVASVTGDTVADVLAFIEANYKMPVVPTEDGNYKLVKSGTTYSFSAIVDPVIPAVPSAPSAAGDYKLNVDADGVATWTAIV